MTSAGIAALRRYKAAVYPLPTETGLYQATLKVKYLVGPGLRHMAKIGIDLDGRWFEYYRGEAHVIEETDIVLGTVRAVDWSRSPEMAFDKLLA